MEVLKLLHFICILLVNKTLKDHYTLNTFNYSQLHNYNTKSNGDSDFISKYFLENLNN